MPSQAKTRKSQSGSTSALSMSGLQVTIWSAWLSLSFILNTKSPIARDNAKFPLTLLNSTKPPADSILALPFVSIGLWSKESGLAAPPTPATQRESPAFEHQSLLPWVRTTTAVLPAISSFRLSSLLITRSHSRKPSLNAPSTSSSVYACEDCLHSKLQLWHLHAHQRPQSTQRWGP